MQFHFIKKLNLNIFNGVILISKISIIVPVYMVEKYIERCILSILNQDFTNFELILVNDGSKDRSKEICEELSKKDQRIVLINKENGGLSSARNAGLKVAKGDYIGFVDSDDWIEKDMYKLLYQNIVKHNADISVCKYKVEKNDQIKVYQTFEPTDVKILNSKTAMDNLLYGKEIDLTQFACDKLYKRELFNDIIYPEGMIYEDVATTYRLIDKASKIIFLNCTKYHYTHNLDSISQGSFDEKQLDLIKARYQLYKFVLENYPWLSKGALSQYISANVSIIKKMLQSNKVDKDIYRESQNVIKVNVGIYLLSSNVKSAQKALATLVAFCPLSIVQFIVKSRKNIIKYSTRISM